VPVARWKGLGGETYISGRAAGDTDDLPFVPLLAPRFTGGKSLLDSFAPTIAGLWPKRCSTARRRERWLTSEWRKGLRW
jgi:hypothetical protein